jgi:hypothetical protein
MKRLSLAIFLGLALLGSGLPVAWAKAVPGPVPDKERTHTKRGPEVGKRVRDLKKYNSRVRAALNIFEVNAKKNGHSPKLDESVSIMRDSAGGAANLRLAKDSSPFRKVGFKPQDADYTGYGCELIFIPSYNTASEWQGTVIINQYDPSGAYIGDYVADVVMTLSGDNGDVIEEVSYSDGQAWLQYGSADFQFGAPLDTQDPGLIQSLISSNEARPQFTKASFAPQGIGWEAGNRPKAPPGPPSPKVRQVMKCSAIGATGVGVACGIGTLLTAGAAFLPCFGAWGAGAVTVCTLTAIFGP